MSGRVAVLESGDLAAAIDRSADAPTARTLVTRVIEANPEVADELTTNALLRDGLVALACASRSLSSAIIADRALLDPLRDPSDFARERSVDDYRRSWDGFEGFDDGALRRWKRREILRIAVRDLLGRADLPAVGRELAALADVCLAAAIATAGGGVGFALVGMGKLGAQELNYASDVDVLFVHEGDGEHADR